MAHDRARSCRVASFVLSHAPWPVIEAATVPPEDRIRQLMTEQVGILRNAGGLTQAREALNELAFGTAHEIRVGEINSKLTNARLISGSALLRTESRGAHFREDYPARDDADWKKRVTACYDSANKRVVFGTIDVAGTKDNAR
jgi:L-aspartate oxidase